VCDIYFKDGLQLVFK